MTASATLTRARSLLTSAGYDDDALREGYPVWVPEPSEVEEADLVAFARPDQQDMSTALVVVHLNGRDRAHRMAVSLGAPFVLTRRDSGFHLSIAMPDELKPWLSFDADSFDEARPWLQPEAATKIKVGLRQLPLFDIPVNFLANAKSKSSEKLGPIVGDALRSASGLLEDGAASADDETSRAPKAAARLVVGALAALVVFDTDAASGSPRTGPRRDPAEVARRAVDKHSATFGWLREQPPAERRVLFDLIGQLGSGIDYRSMDPSVLSHVYEQALVEEDDRRKLGIHYTPPELAARIAESLPVEIIDPEERHVLDPACGSGSLLLAAHERLGKLQPRGWSLSDQHRDLQVRLHGLDIDPFATEIARLALLLKAQPAGNGWAIETRDALKADLTDTRARIIVMNPPWNYTTEKRQHQKADDFMELAARKLETGGLLAAIIPTSWLSTRNTQTTRDQIREQFEVFEIWRLPEGTFSTSRQAPSVLLARKRPPVKGTGRRVVRQIRRTELEPFLDGRPPVANYVMEGASAPLGDVMPPPEFARSTRPLEEVAVIRSGQQPRPEARNPTRSIQYPDEPAAEPSRRENSGRDREVRFLAKFAHVAPYGVVEFDALQPLQFPRDFQSARGEEVIFLRKVLVPAARSANSPWRFRVALDIRGIACTNSVRCIAPLDQSDDELLFGLLAILGSGFASAYAARTGIDRNIPAPLMGAFPIPEDRASIERLGVLGREAAHAAHHRFGLREALDAIEEAVWDEYGVDDAFRENAIRLLSGSEAPEGNVRYPPIDPPPLRDQPAMRRIGAVLGVEGAKARIWINGITSDKGIIVDVPPRMPGWLVRPGATFDAKGIESEDDITAASFDLQPMSWQTLDQDYADDVGSAAPPRA